MDKLPTNEIGRELQVSDLKAHTIVVVQPPTSTDYFTFNVLDVGAEVVAFYAPVLQWGVMNFVRDGKLTDDRGRLVRVFEYLGAP